MSAHRLGLAGVASLIFAGCAQTGTAPHPCAGCGSSARTSGETGSAEPAPPWVADNPNVRRVAISITQDGFEPSAIDVRVGEQVVLAFTRIAEQTCIKRVSVYMAQDQAVTRDLPIGQTVPIAVTFTRAGELGFACGMNMYGGTIRVQ